MGEGRLNSQRTNSPLPVRGKELLKGDFRGHRWVEGGYMQNTTVSSDNHLEINWSCGGLISVILIVFLFLFIYLFTLDFILFVFLYSRFLLVINFILISVYMSIPISQFITPPPPPNIYPLNHFFLSLHFSSAKYIHIVV